MAIVIDGTGTIGGLTAGGLPDASITTADIADANVTPAKLSQPLTLATSQASTSGTFIDFTGIPSWVKRITVMFNGVSTNGTSNWLLQLGAGSATTSGYLSVCSRFSNGISPAVTNYTAGVGIYNDNAAAVVGGSFVIMLIGSNAWSATGVFSRTDTAINYVAAGTVTLSGTLDRVRITTVNGTDTFDAGSINIMYE